MFVCLALCALNSPKWKNHGYMYHRGTYNQQCYEDACCAPAKLSSTQMFFDTIRKQIVASCLCVYNQSAAGNVLFDQILCCISGRHISFNPCTNNFMLLNLYKISEGFVTNLIFENIIIVFIAFHTFCLWLPLKLDLGDDLDQFLWQNLLTHLFCLYLSFHLKHRSIQIYLLTDLFHCLLYSDLLIPL